MAAHLLSYALTGLHVPVSLRARRRVSPRPTRLCARFDSSDPLSWGAASGGDDVVGGDAPTEPLQQLTEAELWALLSSGPGAATGSQALAEAQPASAAEAITAGLVAFKAGRYTEALERFRSSQDLPGSGVMRVRGKPRELSNGELHAALYNSAAALMRMGQFDDALAELSSLVRAGFTDAQLVMQDSDFAELRRLRPNELAALLKPIARAPGPLDWLLNGS